VSTTIQENICARSVGWNRDSIDDSLIEVQELVTKDGYLYATPWGCKHGPVMASEEDIQGLYSEIAKNLSNPEHLVKPTDIWMAHNKNLRRPVAVEEIQEILSATIKRDNPTKALLFLVMLSTYTEQDQQNIAMQAESSAGKSYIPLEIASFFPQDDLIIIASASPTSFFHEAGVLVDENDKPIDFSEKPRKDDAEGMAEWNRKIKNSRILVNLEKKILIFLDMPHYTLMERLRPLLSHDQKRLYYKITDRSEKLGLRTKNVVLIGFPTIVFCSANLNLDEQERTRVFMLSPEVEEEKITESIYLLGRKLGDRDAYKRALEADARRTWLRSRVKMISMAGIRDVIIENPGRICERFLKGHPNPIPRHQRDFPRLIALIKANALFNFSNREGLDDKRIRANDEDIEAGFKLYSQVAKSNEMGISPHVYEIYTNIIQPQLVPDRGVDRKTIQRQYFKIYNRPLTERKLTREILPALESAGLIIQEPDPNDRRRLLVYPTDVAHISQLGTKEKLKLVYGKVEELAAGGLQAKKSDIVEALKGVIEPPEIGQLLGALEREGKLVSVLGDDFWRL